jgi:hypothetical protein
LKARYALRNRIAGFDFFPWLICQKAVGFTEVVFDTRTPKTDKFSIDKVWKRYESILKPGPALLGMKCSEGTEGTEVPGSPKDLCELARKGPIPRLKSVLPPKSVEYTITLRNFERWPHRNSNVKAWETFAAEIGAEVIEDYEVKPIHLHERMALYAGAKMNFFVTNGPVMLCFLSEYPAMGFDVQKSPMTDCVPFGDSYPFLLPQHKQIYEPDDLSVLRSHFRAWHERMG